MISTRDEIFFDFARRINLEPKSASTPTDEEKDFSDWCSKQDRRELEWLDQYEEEKERERIEEEEWLREFKSKINKNAADIPIYVEEDEANIPTISDKDVELIENEQIPAVKPIQPEVKPDLSHTPISSREEKEEQLIEGVPRLGAKMLLEKYPESYALVDYGPEAADKTRPEYWAKEDPHKFLKGTLQPYRGYFRDPKNYYLVSAVIHNLLKTQPERYFEWDLYRVDRSKEWVVPAFIALMKKNPQYALTNISYRLIAEKEVGKGLMLELFDRVMKHELSESSKSETGGQMFSGEMFNQMRRLSGYIAERLPECYMKKIRHLPFASKQHNEMAENQIKIKSDSCRCNCPGCTKARELIAHGVDWAIIDMHCAKKELCSFNKCESWKF